MIKTPKALFHPDGGLFVIWHEEEQVYCPVICDEHAPPAPQTLALNPRYKGITDEETLVWRPVRMTTPGIAVREESLLTPYDPETGEEF